MNSSRVNKIKNKQTKTACQKSPKDHHNLSQKTDDKPGETLANCISKC